MDLYEIYNNPDNEDQIVNKRKRRKKKYPTSEYVSKKRKKFYQKNCKSFNEVFQETIASREVLSEQQNKKQKPTYRKKSSLSMGQSRKKNAKYVNEFKRTNPIRYANVFATAGMIDIDNSAVKVTNSKRVKRQKCKKFQEKSIGVEMDDLLHEGCYSTKCSNCNRPTKLSTDAST